MRQPEYRGSERAIHDDAYPSAIDVMSGALDAAGSDLPRMICGLWALACTVRC
jgi:hypothetical protein